MLGSTTQQQENDTSGIKTGYLFFNVLVISLGFMQFGIGMASFSNC